MAIPKRFKKFAADYPEVAKAYETLRDAVHAAGPLDKKTRSLTRLSLPVGARLEGAVHSHVCKALHASAKPDGLHHAALLPLPTIGLPSMTVALS